MKTSDKIKKLLREAQPIYGTEELEAEIDSLQTAWEQAAQSREAAQWYAIRLEEKLATILKN